MHLGDVIFILEPMVNRGFVEPKKKLTQAKKW